MQFEKIKSVNTKDLESVLSAALSKYLDVKYDVSISNIEYSKNDVSDPSRQKEFTDIKLRLVIRPIEDKDYYGESGEF